MEAAIVTVGDELLSGETANTNATWLAERLSERGVAVKRVLVVPDDVEAIAEAVGENAAATPSIVTSSGVPPSPPVTTTAS
jgi:molybdopterin-biosynthesis enzyme MoeA-like protein